jgi:transposase-like protein
MKNKYVKRSKISEAKFRQIIRYFAIDLDAQMIASLTGLNRNTVNRYLMRIRERIAESGRRPRAEGRADSDAAVDNGTPLVGIRGNGSQIQTDLVTGPAGNQLRRLMRRNTSADRIHLPEDLTRYHGLVDMENLRHYRIAGPNGDCIEAFLGFAHKRLTRQNVLGTRSFELHLKECEFRFNHRDGDIYQMLLKKLRERPLN